MRFYVRATWIMLAMVVALLMAGSAKAQDPSGFVGMLNQARVARGLRPVYHDPNGAAVAHQNNLAQAAGGLGHWVTGGYGQVAAIGAWDAKAALDMWTGSPSHAAIIFAPDLVSVGFSQWGSCATASTTQSFAAVPIYGAVQSRVWTYPAGFRGRRR